MMMMMIASLYYVFTVFQALFQVLLSRFMHLIFKISMGV